MTAAHLKLPRRASFSVAVAVGPPRGWMPGCAAIIVAGATGGRAAVRTLFRRILVWRVGWPWYVLAICGSAAIWLSAVALNPLFGGSGLQIPELSTDLLIGLVINFVLLFLVNSEELVWRGSILPRLQARWSACASTDRQPAEKARKLGVLNRVAAVQWATFFVSQLT